MILSIGYTNSRELSSIQIRKCGIKHKSVGPRGESNPCPGIHNPLY